MICVGIPCLFGWLVDLLLSLSKAKRAYVGFIWVCIIDLLRLERAGKGGRTKGRSIGAIVRSARGSFKTLKCTKMNSILSITLGSNIEHGTRAKKCAANCT